MMNLKDTQPADAEEQFVAKFVTDEGHHPWRRIRLPAKFTGGPEVFVVYLDVYKDLLPGKRPEEPWVECAAAPGESERS